MFKNIILSIIFGAVLFVGWHFLMDLKWSRESSIDIISGAIIEFFLFQLLLYFHSMKQEKQFQKHLAAHLDKIEFLIKEMKGLNE